MLLLNRGCAQELLGMFQMLLLLVLRLHVGPTELVMSALHLVLPNWLLLRLENLGIQLNDVEPIVQNYGKIAFI